MTDTQSSNPIRIDVVSDPACPWCLLGHARLEKVVAAHPARDRIELGYFPFLLDPTTPAEGEDVREMLKRKYGREPDEAWDRLEAEAKTAGLDLDMRKQKMRWPSQPALAVVMAAPTDQQYALETAMGRAYYLDAANISDPDVIADIAQKHGMDADMARAVAQDQAALAHVETMAQGISAQGVTGVPFFIFDQKYALSGAQPEAVFIEVLDKVVAERELSAG